MKQVLLLTWRSLSCFDIKSVIHHLLPSVISCLLSRFKLQTESGAVPPLHDRPHELTPSPHVRTQSPLGCALENPLEESNIINSSIAPHILEYSLSTSFLYYDTQLTNSNKLLRPTFLGLFLRPCYF